jgi:hypothetical protein
LNECKNGTPVCKQSMPTSHLVATNRWQFFTVHQNVKQNKWKQPSGLPHPHKTEDFFVRYITCAQNYHVCIYHQVMITYSNYLAFHTFLSRQTDLKREHDVRSWVRSAYTLL